MSEKETRIVITDIRIPFWRLVFFYVKSAFAVIPALVIVILILSLLGVAVGVMLYALGIAPPPHGYYGRPF